MNHLPTIATNTRQKHLMITVGTTSFDDLISHIFASMGDWAQEFCSIVLQVGSYKGPLPRTIQEIGSPNDIGEGVYYFRYSQNMELWFDWADFVIAHAGAGTLIECCSRKVGFVMVCNPELQGNHQSELIGLIREKKLGLIVLDLNDLYKCYAHQGPIKIEFDEQEVIQSSELLANAICNRAHVLYK